jgi:hypothetical protein
MMKRCFMYDFYVLYIDTNREGRVQLFREGFYSFQMVQYHKSSDCLTATGRYRFQWSRSIVYSYMFSSGPLFWFDKGPAITLSRYLAYYSGYHHLGAVWDHPN